MHYVSVYELVEKYSVDLRFLWSFALFGGEVVVIFYFPDGIG